MATDRALCLVQAYDCLFIYLVITILGMMIIVLFFAGCEIIKGSLRKSKETVEKGIFLLSTAQHLLCLVSCFILPTTSCVLRGKFYNCFQIPFLCRLLYFSCFLGPGSVLIKGTSVRFVLTIGFCTMRSENRICIL